MSDLLKSLLLAIAPGVATEITRHLLEQRAKAPATVQPSQPAPSFAAYVGRHR